MSIKDNNELDEQLVGGEYVDSDECFFVIVIPSYNNKDFYEINLESVLNQDYQSYHIIYINDDSTDGTGELVQNYIERSGRQNKITLINNESRIGSTGNIYKAVHLCHPHTVIVTVDGDDWLAHNRVLSHLSSFYRDPNVWLTYGQYIRHPGNIRGHCSQVPDEVIENNNFRQYLWVTSQLRTFYADLYQKIEKQDLLYNGNFFTMANDLAMMFPMLEMAGEHSRFISDILYVYNVATPFNNHKINRQLQLQMDRHIRKYRRYKPVKKLFIEMDKNIKKTVKAIGM